MTPPRRGFFLAGLGQLALAHLADAADRRLARAHAAGGDRDQAVKHRDLSAGIAATLDDLDDRAVVEADLATLPLD